MMEDILDTASHRELFPVRERTAEARLKRQRMEEFLGEQGLDALLVSRHENIAWATAGLVEVRIASTREVGAASLFFTRGGGSYYLTSNNEAERLAKEEFAHLDFKSVIQPWYANDLAATARKLAGSGKIAGDDAASGFPVASLKALRLQLTEGEIARYRWLGAQVAEATTDALLALRPGMTETMMQARMAERLLERGILPSVLLMAVDDRIMNYRHAVPREGVLQRLGMLNLCARRWGLVISMTRYVHFGAMPAELERRFAAVVRVNAALLDATREGATADALFNIAREVYTEHGFPGEEEMHHQGGAIGYWEREWVARPGGTERVVEPQALAWNPSIRGAKVEDTALLRNGAIEVLTETPQLPVVETHYRGKTYRSSGVLQA